jgi:chemotaxis response regulator CheB
MPPMLLDIISKIIASQADMNVVSDLRGKSGLLSAAEESNADVVILTRADYVENEVEYYDLLYRRPHLKVIEIAGEGGRGSMYELRPHRTPLGEMSPLSLLDAIRASPKS